MALLLILSAAVFLYAAYSPEEHWFFPKCIFHSLTGLYCPGCGVQRAFHHLLNGHIMQSLHYNALAVLALPYVLLGAVLSACRQLNPFWASVRDFLYSGKAVYVVLFIVIAFWVLRNVFTCIAPV